MPNLKLFITSHFLILSLLSAAQKPYFSTNRSLQFQGHYGFFITDAPKALFLRDSYTSFAELSLETQTDGSEDWHRYNRFPSHGVSVLHGNTGSRTYIGKATALFPYIKIPLLGTSRFRTAFKAGGGMAWIEKPYDGEDNHKNTLIGSHLNAIIQLGIINEVKLGRQLFLNVGLSFTHLSNGTSTLPNLGLNIPALTAGIRYAIQPPSSPLKLVQQDSFKKNNTVRLLASFGTKQRPWIGSERHLIPNLQAEAVRARSRVSSLGLGIMLSYDPSSQREIPHAVKDIFDESDLKMQAGIYALYEYKMGRLSIPLQAGVYAFNKYAISSFFQNIGLSYKLNRHWFLRSQLKTHLGKADYIHFGGGYIF